MTFDQSTVGPATLFADIGRQLSRYDSSANAFTAVTGTAVHRVPGAESASIRGGRSSAAGPHSRADALGLLRVASQNSNRKLADIAVEVADTGTLDLPGRLGAGRRRTAAAPSRGPRRPAAFGGAEAAD